MATLPSTLVPTITNTSDKRTDRKLEINFGGGYVQLGSDGLNPLKREVGVTFVGTYAQISTYIDFFDNLKGYQNFQWTYPKEVTQRNWIVGERTITHLSDSMAQLSTTFTLYYGSAT